MSRYLGLDQTFGTAGGVLIVLILLIGLFFAVRELSLWYWKINKIYRVLEKIESNTKKILDK